MGKSKSGQEKFVRESIIVHLSDGTIQKIEAETLGYLAVHKAVDYDIGWVVTCIPCDDSPS